VEPRELDYLLLKKGSRSSLKKSKSASKQKAADEDVIHWHIIRAWCNTHGMTFSDFFTLSSFFAKVIKSWAFAIASYAMINAPEKRNLTAQSREIVIKSQEDKIDGFKIDFSQFLQVLKKNDHERTVETPKSGISELTGGKIVIELDPSVIENAVFNILKIDKGQEMIRSILRKRTKRSET